MEEYVKQVLQAHRRRELSVPGRRLAAVLMPLYRHNDDYGIIFTQRSQTLYYHRGQIAFPGGGHEPHDASLQHTALRESAEEIGLQPTDVHVLGQLDDLLTTNSNYLVRPFVGVIPYPYPFQIDPRETAGIIEVPLAFLRQHNPAGEEVREYEGRLVRSVFFTYETHLIWGATAKILKQFLDLLGPLHTATPTAAPAIPLVQRAV
jgi:8-oxo-dGTP pyrophosphatase MutT (NUDIX family)